MARRSMVKVQFSLSGDDARKAQKYMIDIGAESLGLAAKEVLLQALNHPGLLDGVELDPSQVKRMLADLRMTNAKLVEQNLALQASLDRLLDKVNGIIPRVLDTQSLVAEQLLPLLTETHAEVISPLMKK